MRSSLVSPTPLSVALLYNNPQSAAISLSGDTDFGSTPDGTPVSEIYTITNTGNADLIITAINVPSGFTLTDPALPITIEPGNNDTFTIQANATSSGTFAGDVTIVSNIDDYVFAITVDVTIVYELRHTFASGSVAAGVQDCDVIGQITITDSAAVLSLSGGNLTYATSAAQNDPSFVGVGTFTRQQGRTLLVGGISEAARSMTRFRNSAGSQLGVSGELQVEFSQNIIVVGAHAANGSGKTTSNTSYDSACVLDTVGGLVYIRPAASGDFKLRWLDQVGSNNVIAEHNSMGSNGARTLGQFSVLRDNDNILVNPTINEATPTSTTVYAGTSSAIIDMSVTAPGVLADQTEVRFRVQDASNYYTMYFDSAGAFKLDRVIAGTPTNLINVAAVMAAAGTRRMRVICDGNDIDCWTKSSTTWTKRGSTITSSLLTAYSDVIPVVGTGWSAANLRSDKVFDAAITSLLESWLAGN